jgi:hypothetical protein
LQKLFLAAAVTAIALSSACGTRDRDAPTPRVVILGVDGLDPDLARQWMRDGRLPHMAALAARGGAYELQTLPSPACDAAWASFSTGRRVGSPVVTYEPAQLFWNFAPVAAEKWASARAGTSFWTAAGQSGVRTSVIAVPGTFPPEDVPRGELLAGLPLPDIRRTDGTYHFFSTNVSTHEEGLTKNLGVIKRLTFERRVARSAVVGPLHPVTREELSIPITITWNHEARSANVELGAHTIHLREREWSRWLELDFTVNAITRVRGITQLFLITAGTELQLYVSPIHWHPDRPPAPISFPASFARELYDRLGLFRTLGWNAPTGALNDERLDEAAFMDDVDRAFQDRAETILNRMDAAEWDLLVGVVDTPDRVQHMMWRMIDTQHPRYEPELARRYGASIEQSYHAADELLGEIVSRLPADSVVMVVSDHGFHTLRSNVKWSGDHTSADVAGLLVINMPVTTATPQLIDIAPTVLKHYAVTPPHDVEGRALF